MKVILQKDVSGLGQSYDVVEVKPGYFRNYLLPQGYATYATEQLLKLAEEKMKERVLEREKLMEQAKEVLEKLSSVSLTLKKKASSKGKLYAAITEKHLIDAIEEQEKVKLEEEYIKMDHIKEVGEHKVEINFGDGLSEKITIIIESEK